jgi:hypothetical protein
MDDAGSDARRPRLPLEAEMAFFEAHRAAWIEEGREEQWVAVKDADVLGFFDSMTDAYAAGVIRLGIQPFLIKQVLREDPIVRIPRARLPRRE